MALRSLLDLVDRFSGRGDAPAIIAAHGGGEATGLTYAELGEHIARAARGLRGAGVGDDDVVGLLAPNTPAWVEALLGTIRAGAIAMPFSEQITEDQLARVLEHSGCRHMITTSGHLRTLAALRRPELRILLLADDDDPTEALQGQEVRPWSALLADAGGDLPELRGDRTAVLLYTSGTTGTPKGVPLTHANLSANVDALLDADLATPADRVLLPLPLYHAYPLTVGLLAALAIGAAVVLPAGISGPQIAAALKEQRCTIMIGVPRLYEAMLEGIEARLKRAPRLVGRPVRALLDLAVGIRKRFGVRTGRALFWPLHRQLGPDLRLVASGGARLEPEVAWRLEGLGYEVLTGYGLTETSPLLTFNPPGHARIETAGRPVEGVELRIQPTEEAGDDYGEIQARGPNVFKGYWRNPEVDREAFTEDGFFRTGDLGFLDADGYLHIVGRSKELIVLAGGKNVFPEDVEAVLAESELVREVAVLEHDNRLVGLFVPEAGATGAEDELRDRFRREVERLSGRLPAYERLADFALTRRTLPRTHIGKLRRHELPAIYEAEKAEPGAARPAAEITAEDRALLETPPLDRVWAWLQERFPDHEIGLDTSPQFDLGLDSFDWMSLSMELGERFGAHLDEDAIARVSTLRDLLREVEQAASRPPGEDQELSPAQARWLEPHGPVLAALARAMFGLNRVVMRTLFRLRVEGTDRLPAHGPYLIAPNHASFLDPFALAAALPWQQHRHVYWAGWTGLLFRGPLTRLFSRLMHVVPVDPEHGLTSTLGIGRAVLDHGHALVWFPEGERSRTGELRPFLPGAGWLLEKTGVAAVPVLIEGTHAAWPPDRRFPRLRRLRIRIGDPVPLQTLAPEGAPEDRHARIAAALRARVETLADRADD